MSNSEIGRELQIIETSLMVFESPFNCYVFADYQCHLFTYAIRLHPKKGGKNEIYFICGDEFRIIADNFSQFVNKYIDDCEDLQF
jgi:hypothetical protein